jgi:hypothetical protein
LLRFARNDGRGGFDSRFPSPRGKKEGAMPLDLEWPIELSPLWLRDIALDAQASAFALWALWLAAWGLA